jgi:hypothetical protein
MTSLTASSVRTASAPFNLQRDFRRARISCLYRWRHGRWPDLDRPELFTEWVQWRKLNQGPDDPLARLTDKLFSKSLVGARCGADLCVPTLWAGTDLPENPPGQFPLMVKANHGCGQIRVVRSLAGWRKARRAAARWVAGTYGSWLDEFHYCAARRLLIVEPYLADQGGLPDDYKVYVFGGRAEVIQHHVRRGSRAHRWTQFDVHWKRVGGAISIADAPVNLERMIEAAELLAGKADFLRVDFYEVDGRLWFGEFCLFPGSGLDPFEPIELDRRLGALWSQARSK